ncbi:MAG: hypothetical protein AAB731_01885, partial [Patescibacteria group bacterium]
MENAPKFFVSGADDEREAKQPSASKEHRRAEDFFGKNLKIIEDYAGAAGFDLRPGSGWSIDLENKVMTYDVSWFEEREFSPAEAMWASCHEMEHLRDWFSDPEAFSRLFARFGARRRLHVLYNCLDDVMVNRAVDDRFPAHQPTKERLYRERLFPDTDYTKTPAHLQYIYAILRERMLPKEKTNLAPEVRAEVDRLRDIDGAGTDLVELLTRPGAAPEIRYEIVRDYIEPIYEKFYREDLDREKEKKKSRGKGEPKAGEADFASWYDDLEKKGLPHPIPMKDVKDAIKKEAARRQKNKDNTDPDKRARGQFQSEHGLTNDEMRELEGPYRAVYKEIEPLIAPLREIFERIISRRKERVRRLSK